MIKLPTKILAFILSTTSCILLTNFQIDPFTFYYYENLIESTLIIMFQSSFFYFFIFIPISFIIDNTVLWAIYRFKRFNKIRKFEAVALITTCYIIFVLLFQLLFAIYYRLIGVDYFNFSYPLLISISIFSFVIFILNAFTRNKSK
jgi:hypothetical protein